MVRRIARRVVRHKVRPSRRPVKRKRRSVPDRLVYCRWDPVRRRRWALKQYANLREGLREARVLRALRGHPQVPRLYRYGVHRGRAYLAMEWVRGIPLSVLIKARRRIPLPKIIDIGQSLLKALGALHRRGIIHGDVHADNVIVTDYATAAIKLIDFQHAVRMNRRGKARARRRIARPELMLPPETRRGIVDVRYDLYGVGYICACMMKGKMLTRRRKIGRTTPARAALWRVIRKAMDPRPARRYRSAEAMSRALDAVRARLPHPQPRPSLPLAALEGFSESTEEL